MTIDINTKEWCDIFLQSPIGIAFVSLDHKFVHANPKFLSILEYTYEELVGKTVSDVTHPDDYRINKLMYDKVLSGQIPGYEMLKRYLTKSGKILWTRLTVWLIRNEKDEPMHYVTHVQPLMNGEKAAVKQINDNQEISTRPSLTLRELFYDNFKSIVVASVFITSTIIGLGVTLYAMKYELELVQDTIAEQRQLIYNLYDKMHHGKTP